MIMQKERVEYYNQDGVIVRPSTLLDVNNLSTCLRQSDIDEIWASNHIKPFQALHEGLKKSILCLTIEYKYEAVGIFGIHADDLVGDRAIIWFLASDEIDNMPVKFLRNNRRFIELMLGFYPYLYNWVDARNVKSIAWLRFLGAKIEDAKRFGIDQMLFHKFSFSRE